MRYGRLLRVRVAEGELASRRVLGGGGYDEGRAEYDLTEPVGGGQFLAARPERCHEGGIVGAERRIRGRLPDIGFVHLVGDENGCDLRIEHQDHRILDVVDLVVDDALHGVRRDRGQGG